MIVWTWCHLAASIPHDLARNAKTVAVAGAVAAVTAAVMAGAGAGGSHAIGQHHQPGHRGWL
jgi:hypothetical protein